ncbi:MAG: hypothetical protein DWP97_11875 [Calditrichaeota bacterium]|nr:MAG: hypothetical protein DWP97_11875 [Calditrichota bacterium]
MNKIILSVLVVCISLTGCENEPDLGPQDEKFVGTYLVRDLTLTEDEILEDSITFRVIRNTTYEMSIFYHIRGLNEMCSNSGTILDFGTGKASFDPTNVAGNNCQNRAPFGTFAADFINIPGEIHITKSVQGTDAQNVYYDSLYQIILKQ